MLGFGLFGDFVSQPGRICGRYVVVGKKCFSAEISTKTGSAILAKVKHQWSTFSYAMPGLREDMGVSKVMGVPPNHPVTRHHLTIFVLKSIVFGIHHKTKKPPYCQTSL